MLGGKQYINNTQDTHCIFKDDFTFCSYIDKNLKNINKIVIYNNNSVKLSITEPKDIHSILAEITRNKNVLTKTLTGNKSINSFKKELECNYIIFHNIPSKYHNVRESFKYKSISIIGLQIIYNNKQDTFHLFVDNDFTYLTDIKELSQKQYDKLVDDIKEQLDTFNKSQIQHNDIKPDNIVYSTKNKRFLLIRWLYSHEVRTISYNMREIGNKIFNHPIKYYLARLPALVSRKVISYGLLNSKYKWIKQLPSYLGFKSFIDSSLDFILYKYGHMNSKQLHQKFANHYDYFSFGMLVFFLGEKYKFDIPKKTIDELFKEFIPKYII